MDIANAIQRAKNLRLEVQDRDNAIKNIRDKIAELQYEMNQHEAQAIIAQGNLNEVLIELGKNVVDAAPELKVRLGSVVQPTTLVDADHDPVDGLTLGSVGKVTDYAISDSSWEVTWNSDYVPGGHMSTSWHFSEQLKVIG